MRVVILALTDSVFHHLRAGLCLNCSPLGPARHFGGGEEVRAGNDESHRDVELCSRVEPHTRHEEVNYCHMERRNEIGWKLCSY